MSNEAKDGSKVKRLKLTVVRHGVTDLNVASVLQGHTDCALNADGRLQAWKLGEHFSRLGVGFTSACSSDLARAVETAQLVLQPQSVNGSTVQLYKDSRLRERCYGYYEGSSCARFIAAARAKRINPEYYTPESVESVQDFSKRIESWFNTLCQDIEKNGHVLVVAHGGSIRRLFAYFYDSLRCPFFGDRRQAVAIPPNTAYSTFVIQNCRDANSDVGVTVKCETLHFVGHLT